MQTYRHSGAASHKKSRRKKSNADKDIKLRAKVYFKHTVTMYDQHDCCNILQKKVDANASLASAWRRHCIDTHTHSHTRTHTHTHTHIRAPARTNFTFIHFNHAHLLTYFSDLIFETDLNYHSSQ
jgi:hypothetical protein